jgi:hypothetical protein
MTEHSRLPVVLAVAFGLAALGAVTTRVAAGSSSGISSNWAGYVVTALDSSSPISFESATATWKQPKARCGAGDAGVASAAWVGLGGYSSQQLQQVGTYATCNRFGKPTYSAWYEVLPSTAVKLRLGVRPGDTITASVSLNRAGTRVRMQIADRTTGLSAIKQLSVPASDSTSAEWIVEAPATCNEFRCRPLPLADFGSVSFSNIGLTGDGHAGTLTDSAWQAIPIRLVPDIGRGFFPGGPHPERGSSGSTAGAVPTAPAAGGRSFTVTWQADAAAPRGALAR